MSVTTSQIQAEINSLKPGRPVVAVDFDYAAGDDGASGLHVFDTAFSGTPDVIAISVEGVLPITLGAVSVSSISSTNTAITLDKGTSVAASVRLLLQGEL